jgi:hypothetical protein
MRNRLKAIGSAKRVIEAYGWQKVPKNAPFNLRDPLGTANNSPPRMVACSVEGPCLQRPRTLEHNFSRLLSLQIGWNVYLPWSNLNGLFSKFLAHTVNLGSTENMGE